MMNLRLSSPNRQRTGTATVVILGGALLFAGAKQALAEPGDHPSRDRFLLLDSRVVAQTKNARLAVGTVEKSKHNPLFGEDNPWEVRFDNLYGNVFYDETAKLYKCWYSPFIVDRSAKGMTLAQREKRYRPGKGREMGICYATSKDGLTWDKPALNLESYHGSRENNIVWRGPHCDGVSHRHWSAQNPDILAV